MILAVAYTRPATAKFSTARSGGISVPQLPKRGKTWPQSPRFSAASAPGWRSNCVPLNFNSMRRQEWSKLSPDTRRG
jgi:hypothetical protein